MAEGTKSKKPTDNAVANADDDSEPKPDAVDLVEAQQRFYQEFGHKAHIIYDRYPTMSTLERKLCMLFTGEKKREKSRALAEVIWAQRCFVGVANSFGLRMSPIFVFCAYDKSVLCKRMSYPLSMKSSRYSIHPVFRVQKCVKNGSDERGCCAIFIDELGRVYEHWDDFMENNKFDDCIMLTPTNGVYAGDKQHDTVMLEVRLRQSGITQLLDASSLVVGVGAAVVSLGAAIPAITVAPAVVLGATVVGVGSAVYTGARSIYNLYDRASHEQPIGLGDKESRAAWLNIATGVLLSATAGASQLVSKAIEKGKDIPRVVDLTVKGTQLTTFGMQTAGCADGIFTIVSKLFDGDDISMLEVAQLGTALFLWTHSARNLGVAESAVKITGEKNTMATKRYLLTTQKTAINTLTDYKFLINAVREVDGSTIVRDIQATFSFSSERMDDMESDLSNGVPSTVKVEYCNVFDTRMEAIVQKLDIRYKHTTLSSLKNWLIKLMCNFVNMTLRGLERMVDYVHRLGVENLEQFERILSMLTQYIKDELRANLRMNANDFITGLSNGDRRCREHHEKIRKMVENCRRNPWNEPQQDEGASTSGGITDDKKVSLALVDRVEDVMIKFKDFDIGGREVQLRETVTGILKVLKPHLAETFFGIVALLVLRHAENIRKSLRQSIPLDYSMSAIFCLLEMRSDADIENILAEYQRDMFDELDAEFQQIYLPITSVAKIVKCKKCSGKKCDN